MEPHPVQLTGSAAAAGANIVLPPAVLAEVSPGRQEQLLRRANAELNQPQQLNLAVSAHNFVIMYSLGLADFFLILLLIKLEYAASIAWTLVFLPLWLLDLLGLSREFLRPPVPPTSGYITGFKVLHLLSLAVTKITILLKLEGVTKPSTPLVLLLLPLWCDAVIGFMVLCLAPPPPQVTEARDIQEHRQGLQSAALTHIIAWGLQAGLIAAKIDGVLAASWGTVFVPAYLALLMLVIVLLASALSLFSMCCSMCLRFFTLQRSSKLLVLVLSSALVLMYGTIICSSIALRSLEGLLDNDGTAVKEVLLPLIAITSAAFVLVPFIVGTSVILGHMQVGGALGGTAARPELTMEPLAGPIAIIRQSSTYFRQVTDNMADEEDREDIESGNYPPSLMDGAPVKMCYVCEDQAPDAVLLDCGHGGLCYGCAQNLAQQGDNSCPICRKQVVTVLRLPHDAMLNDDNDEAERGRVIRSLEGFSLTLGGGADAPGRSRSARDRRSSSGASQS